jgi:hypothetical protein
MRARESHFLGRLAQRGVRDRRVVGLDTPPGKEIWPG